MSSQPCPFRHGERTDTQSHLSAASSTPHFTNYFFKVSSKTRNISPTWEFFPERLIPCHSQPIVSSHYCLFKMLLLSVLTVLSLLSVLTEQRCTKTQLSRFPQVLFFHCVELQCPFIQHSSLLVLHTYMKNFLLDLISIKSWVSHTKELVFVMFIDIEKL